MTLPARKEQIQTKIPSLSSNYYFDGPTPVANSSSRCIGVFDTVGSLGLPGELTIRSKKINQIFGFSDRLLGEHIENAFHALALNETRADFVGVSHYYISMMFKGSTGLC